MVAFLCCSFLLLLASNVESRAAVLRTPNAQVSSLIKEHSRTAEEYERSIATDDESHMIEDEKIDEKVAEKEMGEDSETATTTSLTETGVEIVRQIVKRSTDVMMGKTIAIDWMSVRMTLLEITHILRNFVSEAINKLTSTYSTTVVPFFKRLLPAMIPFSSTFIDHPLVHSAVASSTSIDWRSAGTALFDTIVKFKKLRDNEV